jgi:BioD-like phosphotransacetylase family protein
MVLAGGIIPGQPIMNVLTKSAIPVLMAKEDTYAVASYIHDLTVKIRPSDTAKIDAVVKLIKYNVDLDEILKGM